MTTIDQQLLDQLTLAKGGHDDPEDGLCLMEAVAWVRGLDHTDHPPCVAPVLGGMGRNLNDLLGDDMRQQLKPLIPLLPGTAGDGQDEARGYMALDWLIRTYTPAWLDLAGLAEEARTLRDLRRIVDLAAAQSAGPVVKAVREKARAAGADAGSATSPSRSAPTSPSPAVRSTTPTTHPATSTAPPPGTTAWRSPSKRSSPTSRTAR
jgi:hypothetical protein